MSFNESPRLIEGGVARDARGSLIFANDFDMRRVKRFYMVENSSLEVVRAWHGHAKEAKYVFVPSGRALVGAVVLDDLVAPSKQNKVQKFILSADKPEVLYIPGGYANGVRSLEAGTKIIFFSTATLEESKNDDFRFSVDYWGNDIWSI